MKKYTLIALVLLITSCSDYMENKIDLESIQIEENSSGNILVVKSGDKVILKESRRFSKQKDLLYDAFIEPMEELPSNSPGINEAYFLMHFAQKSKTYTDSADMLLVHTTGHF